MDDKTARYNAAINARLISNIRAVCALRKTSIPKIEQALGYGNGAITAWKNAKKLAPTRRVNEIADFLNVSADSLYREELLDSDMLAAPQIAEDTVTFPVIGGVAAGYDRIGYQDWTGDSLEIPRSYLHGRKPQDYFVLRVQGDSMYPDYQDGDHVLVLSQTTMDRSGQVGVVMYRDENATLKKVEYVMGEDWMTLRPVNPQFPPVTIRDEELEHCKVLGVAKMVIREVNP